MAPITKTRLRKRIYVFAAGLVAVAGVATWFIMRMHKEVGVEGPGILFEQKNYDAGTILAETTSIVRHRFPFRNHGTQTLQITDIKTSCGCAVVDEPKGNLAPGKEGFLHVELTLGSLGRHSSDILVYSNSASSPDRLTIAATFNPKASTYANPLEMRFEQVNLDDAVPELLSINAFSQRLELVKIEHIESQFGQVETKLIETTTSQYRNQLGYYRTTFRLDVLPCLSSVGEFKDHLTVHFTPSFFPKVEVPISGRAVPKLVLHPHKVFFVLTQRQKGNLTPKTLFLYHVKRKHLSFVSVSNHFTAWLDISTKPSSDQTKLEITLEPKYVPGPIDGNIELIVQPDGEEPEAVNIPISVLILRHADFHDTILEPVGLSIPKIRSFFICKHL